MASEKKGDSGKKISILKLQGESIQMKFEGAGFVVVQPCEEVYFQGGQTS